MVTFLKVHFGLGRLCIAALSFALMSGLAQGDMSSARIVKPPSLDDFPPAMEMTRNALRDTLYYRFDPWLDRFRKKVESLERLSPSLPVRMELMRSYFALAGLYGELSHALSFTSAYKLKEVEDGLLEYSGKAKEAAGKILDMGGLTSDERAQAYLFLGASEGYIGIFEYGSGNLIRALINGLQADGHMEEALLLDPGQVDAHFGLGLYRYGNSRLGGIGNFVMQGGEDLRLVGLNHIEHAIQSDARSTPLALKTLIWFYISEQINADNQGVPADHPLSSKRCRRRVLDLLEEVERRFLRNPPYPDFIGNKEIALMRAMQNILDANYDKARTEFERVVGITRALEKRGFRVNPQLTQSMEAGIRFCDLMLLNPPRDDREAVRSSCQRVREQVTFLNSGKAMVAYDSQKIRGELQGVFARALKNLSRKFNC